VELERERRRLSAVNRDLENSLALAESRRLALKDSVTLEESLRQELVAFVALKKYLTVADTTPSDIVMKPEVGDDRERRTDPK
jgi:hypothetical protein